MVPPEQAGRPREDHSPRIRGDGPDTVGETIMLRLFSPYSRGWSRLIRDDRTALNILPVFAGMVPRRVKTSPSWMDSPRIRGDGPKRKLTFRSGPLFSPYSRGWSRVTSQRHGLFRILPVFAGMVPCPSRLSRLASHSPRIRGDGPMEEAISPYRFKFSPYSRGWSHTPPAATNPR